MKAPVRSTDANECAMPLCATSGANTGSSVALMGVMSAL
jgi:hypothetical protein